MTGMLALVVGGSGVGKDTLLNASRAVLRHDPAFVFARRIITRTAMADLEDHDTLDEAAFAREEAAGRFLLSWRANGLAYGLPGALRLEFAAGRTVVANVSRRVIGQAEALGAPVVVVHVTASAGVRAARLAKRGRETEQDVALRLSRDEPLSRRDAPVIEVRNDGAVEAGVRAMLDALLACRTPAVT